MTTSPQHDEDGGRDGEQQFAYIASLEVENIRCFGPEQTLDLTDPDGDGVSQWTVLVGDNGTGKTTLLELLALVTPSVWVSEPDSNLPDHYAAPLLDFPSSNYIDGGFWKTFARQSGPNSSSHEGEYDRARLAAQFYWGNRSSEPSVFSNEIFSIRYSSRPKGGGGQSSPLSDGKSFLLGYGANRRIGSSDEYDKNPESRWKTLVDEAASLPDPEDWLKQVDYAASKSDSETSRAAEKRDHIVELLTKVMPDVEAIEFDVLEDEPTPEPVVRFKTPYGWVSMEDLSLGYRTMISWIVDMTRRMFEEHPQSDDPLAEPAIVLVDEFDLHLHPKWQRKLINHLTERFPNTQFVVTAHSPLLVQAATDIGANLAVLRRKGDHAVIQNEVEAIRGWTIDQILGSDIYELSSVRPPSYDDLLEERKELLQKPELTDEERERLDEIKEEIGSLPGGETAWDVEAMDTIHRFANSLEALEDDEEDGGDDSD